MRTATFTCLECKGAGDVGWNGRVKRCDECDGKGILGEVEPVVADDIHYRFEIEPRPLALGPGWQLRLLEKAPGCDEIEVGGGVFPFVINDDQDSKGAAYADALEVADEWLESRVGS
jgi:hypothetical protein